MRFLLFCRPNARARRPVHHDLRVQKAKKIWPIVTGAFCVLLG